MNLNKILTISFLLSWLSLPGMAQLPLPVQEAICSARLSPFLGIGISSPSSEYDRSEDSGIASPVVGANVHISMGGGWTLIPGLAYETKGSAFSYSYDNGIGRASLSGRNTNSRTLALRSTNESKTRTVRSYLSFPWQIGIRPFEKVPDLQFALGMNNSFLLGQKTTRNSFGIKTTDRGTDNLKGFNLGLLLGVSYRVIDDIAVGITYDHGLTDMSSSGVGFRERALRLTVGYTINFNPIFLESYSRRGRAKMKQYQTSEE